MKRRFEGNESRMKESYTKSLANYSGPESCRVSGNRHSEALTGVHAGQVLSCEINPFGMPMKYGESEGNICSVDKGEYVNEQNPTQSLDLGMYGNSLPVPGRSCKRPEILVLWTGEERDTPYPSRLRLQEVGLLHSTCETFEQTYGCVSEKVEGRQKTKGNCVAN